MLLQISKLEMLECKSIPTERQVKKIAKKRLNRVSTKQALQRLVFRSAKASA